MPANPSQPLHDPWMTGALEHTHRPVLQSTTTDNSLQSTPFATMMLQVEGAVEHKHRVLYNTT